MLKAPSIIKIAGLSLNEALKKKIYEEGGSIMHIFLVRHCQAEGQSFDASLTADGRVQSERLAELLHTKNIDSVLSSPFARAYQLIHPSIG